MQTKDLESMLSELILSMELIKQQQASLFEELTYIKQHLKGSTLSNAAQGWLQTRSAAVVLQMQGVVSPKQLKEMVAIGLLRVDSEVRNVGTEKQPRYEFHIPSCEKRIAWFKSLSPQERKVLFGGRPF